MKHFIRVTFPGSQTFYTYHCGDLRPKIGDIVACPANIVLPEGSTGFVVRVDGPQKHLEHVKEIKKILRIVPEKEGLRFMNIEKMFRNARYGQSNISVSRH